MNKEEFFNYVKDNFKDYLPEELKSGEVVISKVNKNNSLLTGLSVRPDTPNRCAAPVLYLDGYYEAYKDKKLTTGEILGELSKVYVAHSGKTIDVDSLTVYENVKDKVFPKIVGFYGNEEFLKDKIYRKVQDMAVLYYVDIDKAFDTYGGHSSLTITEPLRERYGVTEEDLYKQAMKNQKEAGYEFKNMNEIMEEMAKARGIIVPPEMVFEENPLYVLSNNDRLLGASLIANTDILAEIADKNDWDEFYIIPSSIHEVIIISDMSLDPEALRQMVREVNGTEVSSQDKLSDSVYTFNAESLELNIADDNREEDISR